MKRMILLAAVLLLVTGTVHAAFTNSAADFNYNSIRLFQRNGQFSLWSNEIEDYLDGTTPLPFVRILESTGATYYTTIQGGDQSANLTLTLPTGYAAVNGYVLSSTTAGALSWVANAGTFNGGTIANDCVLGNGVDLQSTTTTAHTNAIQGYADAGVYKDVLRWTNGATVAAVLGAGDVSFALASTGVDISVAGAISSATTIQASGAITAGGWSGTGNFAQGDGTGTASFNTGSWDISTAGAMSGFSTLSLSGDITMANGKGVKGTAVSGETVGLYGYDNDTGPGYVSAVVVTNGNTPATELGNTGGTTEIKSNDWAISKTGAMTGIGAITADGLISGTAGATISGATISLNSNSNFGLDICTGTSSGPVAIGGGNGTFAVNSTGLDISTGGALTNAASIAGANSNAINLAINNRFEFTDNSETFGFDVGTTANTVKLCTDSGIDTVDFNDLGKLTSIESVAGDYSQTISFLIDNRFEFTENSETLALIFGNNVIELGTDSGIDTVDFNDVDKLIDIESMAGDNGQTISFATDNRIEITENSETFALIFGNNTLELGTDSGIDTIDFNDVDKLVDVESITGDGTGSITGFLKGVVNDPEPHAILVTESGKVLTNAGSDGADAWTLPAATAGLEYRFVVMAVQEMRITPAAGDKIIYGSTAMGIAEYYYADGIGESLHILAVDDTNWIVLGSTGSWAEQNP